MNKFHPAKPVSVYNIYKMHWKVGRFRPFSYQQNFLESLRKRVEEHHRNFNWQSYVPFPFGEIYDASMKGLNSYLEISKDGSMTVHVKPEKLE